MDAFFDLIAHLRAELIDAARKSDPDAHGAHQLLNEMDDAISNASSKQDLLSDLKQCAQRELQKYNEKKQRVWAQQIEIAIEYMKKNYARDISLGDISDIAYMSPTYFCTLFKKETGKNFGDYLTEIRIERAKELLSTTLIPIAKVAEQVGYKSANYFSKVFLKAVGIKPSEYRHLYLKL